MSPTDRLRGILDLVEHSLDEPDLTAGELAARAYLSRYHFDRLISASIGEPPGSFRRRLLLERAAHRLVTGDDPVIDLAFGSGYGSPEAFSRAFARAYGRSPSQYRRNPPGMHEIPGTSGIHFNPPAGLRLPALTRSTAMDVLTKMIDHHLWLVEQIIDRMNRLDDPVLDRPIELPVEGIDENPTLRTLGDRLVGQLEMWIDALQGATSMPPAGDRT
ncbi:MAG: AraC family transcriptional regulator, partial [Actinomycetia bacterium]|nr:AraC family transcriptional regulator [Actinomycetes bacterium]